MFSCDRFLLEMTDMGNEFLQDVKIMSQIAGSVLVFAMFLWQELCK